MTAEREARRPESVGVACVDVPGDFDTDVAAQLARSVATRPHREALRSGRAGIELNAARLDQALNGLTPAAGALDGQTRNEVRVHAQRTVDQIRSRRIADVVRRGRRLWMDCIR